MGRQKKKSPSSKRKSPRNKSKSQSNGSSPTKKGSSREERLNNVERITSRGAGFGSTLVHLGVIWAICGGLALTAWHSHAHNSTTTIVDGYNIPQETLSAWTEYPNPLNITDNDRAKFRPVVKFPQVWMDIPQEDGSNKMKREKVDNYKIVDHTASFASVELATEQERQLHKKDKSQRRVALPTHYAIGRYDENRVNLYKSDLFDDESNDIDGFAGARTVHIGIDLDGPIGTKVHAFADGIVHSAGYNADLGDYGNVIVLEHDLGNGENGEPRKLWALYGHLDDKSIVGKKQGKKIKKGQVIGRFGDIHENGGW